MKAQIARRSSLFLMELIVAIFFFSLASAVCVQLFARARTQSLATENLNGAVTQTQSFAEAAYQNDDPFSLYPYALRDGENHYLSFDESWQQSPFGSNQLIVTVRKENGFTIYDIRALTKENSTVYQLQIQRYTPEGKEPLPHE